MVKKTDNSSFDVSLSNFDFSIRYLRLWISNLLGSGSDMNWVQRKIYLYNVTFGLYMLDWWERYLFNGLVVVLMWFVAYNGTRYFSELFKRHLT
ncbi:uncharacterized protein LOC106427021 [Brassica napus]|uniref:uncharacterized protein LOC106427021 n=1 Tax=Brassica napus TaxID=3708 RepID=UPI000BBECB2B|nr:uncharacterized protein LOC106427021 [Brassica napus]